MAVGDLKAHIDHKMSQLDELAKGFNLSPETVEELRQHLQSELDYFNAVDDNTTLGEVMGHYFDGSAEFRRKVTGEE